MSKKITSIYLDKKLLKDIDKERGLAPRSTFIEHNLRKVMLKLSEERKEKQTA